MGGNNSSAAPQIPEKMKRIVMVEHNADFDKAKFEVQEVDTPVPQKGEVLVRMVAAPVNPSDYGTWRRVKPDEAQQMYLGKEGGFRRRNEVKRTCGFKGRGSLPR